MMQFCRQSLYNLYKWFVQCLRGQIYSCAWKKKIAIKRLWQYGTPSPVGIGTVVTINMAGDPSAHSYYTRTIPVYKDSGSLLGQDFQCGLSIVIREKFPLTQQHNIAAIQTDKNKQSLVLERMQGKCTCIHCWWECKWVQPFGRWFSVFSKILKWVFTSAEQFCSYIYIYIYQRNIPICIWRHDQRMVIVDLVVIA